MHAEFKIRKSRGGVHLFDRRSGLNVLVSESKVLDEALAKAPRYVSIALTNACDLHCAHCYAPKSSARLELTRLLGWLAELDSAGTLGVGFGGGEPLLFPGFAYLCQQAAQQTGLAITFTTHGHSLTRAMADALRGSVHFLRVSVDGVGITYERLRGRRFAKLRQQLALARSIAPFGVNMVVNADTVDQLDAVAEFASQQQAAQLLLLPEHPTGERRGIDSESMRKLEEWILRTPRRIALAISEAGLTSAMPAAEPYCDDCPLEAHAHVDASGVVKANAYSQRGVPINHSIVAALNHLKETFP